MFLENYDGLKLLGVFIGHKTSTSHQVYYACKWQSHYVRDINNQSKCYAHSNGIIRLIKYKHHRH